MRLVARRRPRHGARAGDRAWPGCAARTGIQRGPPTAAASRSMPCARVLAPRGLRRSSLPPTRRRPSRVCRASVLSMRRCSYRAAAVGWPGRPTAGRSPSANSPSPNRSTTAIPRGTTRTVRRSSASAARFSCGPSRRPGPWTRERGRWLRRWRPGSPALTQVFDTVWSTLKRLYYGEGESAAQWDALRKRYRSEAEQARTDRALEEIVDRMVAEQPLIKPPVTSSRAVVVSGHPLASEAGRMALARGGNIVDAAIAVSFALGVVEPDASGIGGDGQAVLFLKGMAAPTVIEYKDQTPRAATLDNPKVLQGTRLVGDGPAVGQHPGCRRRARLSLYAIRERPADVGRTRRAGDSVCRGRFPPGPGAAVEHRRGAAVLPEVSRPRRASTCPGGACRSRAIGS